MKVGKMDGKGRAREELEWLEVLLLRREGKTGALPLWAGKSSM